MLKRWLIYLASVLFGLALVGGLLVAFVFAVLYPTLPSLETLTDYQPKIPLRVVSVEGDLLGEFGEERRAIVKIKDVPELMRQAILAAEDERFYQHGGVDYLSVMRAALANVTSGTPRLLRVWRRDQRDNARRGRVAMRLLPDRREPPPPSGCCHRPPPR